ncbi:MAG: EAL domain-containing protein [Gammaproteobacteria bacterium]|nr:EAL domain-containing protein [Gammaproteobacteria bacterium]
MNAPFDASQVSSPMPSDEPYTRALLEQQAVGVAWIDAAGRYQRVNPRFCEMLGYSDKELLARNYGDVTHPEDLDSSSGMRTRLVSGAQSSGKFEKRYVRKDGRILWAEVSASVVHLGRDESPIFLMIIQDVSARKRQEQLLADERALLERLAAGGSLENALQSVAVLYSRHALRHAQVVMYRLMDDAALLVPVAAGGALTAFRDALHMLPVAPDSSLSARAVYYREPRICADVAAAAELGPWRDDMLAKHVRSAFSLPVLTADGIALGAFTVCGEQAGEPAPEDMVLAQRLTNLTAVALEKQRTLDSLLHIQSHDMLTGLPTRELLMAKLRAGLERARREHRGLALLLINIRSMNRVNDTYGHEAGDRLLLTMAARLRELVGGNNLLARPGGNELALLLEDVADEKVVWQFVRTALKLINAPHMIAAEEIAVSANIGIALARGDSDCPAAFLRQADMALHQARAEGGNRAVVYADRSNALEATSLVLAAELQRALERGEFMVHYQPQVELQHGRIAGAEALLRWQHPTRGVISPLDFIPVLEETGLINPVGKWVLEEVAARMADLQQAGLPLPHVAVNLSSRQLHDTQLVNVIRGVLQRYRLLPATLTLELTETLVMRDTRETRMAFDALHELGVRLSVDDFGTGYSSLSYLKHLPLNVLKIDKKFVDEVCENRADGAIVGAIIMMSHNLGMQVVAEGVETAAQLDFLRLRSCDQMQGYLFSKPVPFADLRAMLAADQRQPVSPHTAGDNSPPHAPGLRSECPDPASP